jgi:hypothetical protein
LICKPGESFAQQRENLPESKANMKKSSGKRWSKKTFLLTSPDYLDPALPEANPLEFSVIPTKKFSVQLKPTSLVVITLIWLLSCNLCQTQVITF